MRSSIGKDSFVMRARFLLGLPSLGAALIGAATVLSTACVSSGEKIGYFNRNPAKSPYVNWPTPTGEVEVDATVRLPDGRSGVRLVVADDGRGEDGRPTTVTWQAPV